MGHVRRALLIGVARAPHALDRFAPLDEPVAADLRAMRAALEESGYEVDVLQDAEQAAVGTRVFEAAADAPEGSTLLLYFTGHGVRIGDTDYLVPADARTPKGDVWQKPYLDTLFPADIGDHLRGCRAGTVLWLVDACRDPLHGGDEAAFGSRILNGPPGGRFAVMVGCSPGQRGGCTPEGSFFTRGLADALGSLSAPRTVHEVYEAARSRTEQAAHRHRLTQQVWIRYGADRETETRAAVVCDGRRLLEEWRDAVRDDGLWERVDPRAADGAPRLREALTRLVESCAHEVRVAQDGLLRAGEALHDPWTDEHFPVRLLRRGLLLLLPKEPVLSAAELAVLIAAPFLREAAWARRLRQAAEVEPLTAGRVAEAGDHRRHLEQLRDHYAHVARKQAACRARGRTEDENALALWLVHRWIAERFETDEEPVPTDLCDSLAAALLGDRDGVSDRADELSATLRSLAAGIGLDTPLDDVLDCPARTVRLPEQRQPLRVRPLTALLRLGAALAADVRTFPDIIADHLAVTDPVRPEDVVKAARHALDWAEVDDDLRLEALCPHQAVHAAFTEIADRADRLAALTREAAAELPEEEKRLLAGVPARVTSRGLRPCTGRDGRKAYEVPLLRFHLAQTEVRDLLMGRQLYGDPSLAVRELYQNAMDACRYRAMRWRYLHHRGRRPADWTGRISIVQGEDARGRYLECRDNGNGMGLDQFKNTFTRAGSRFEQSRAFRREQAGWLRRDPALRLYPNSRFGIGVLSYFMLADEMAIVTREVLPTGAVAADALRIDIPSSGSLFRVQRHDDAEDGLAEGGTRVRLYLRDDPELAGLSCVEKARELIGVSEFALEVRDASGTRETWEARALHGRDAPCAAVRDVLWWVDGKGAILCDGVATDHKPYGYVLNLTGAHAGTLSVNRNELLDYDEEWARENWRLGAAALPDWPGFTMQWLWRLEDEPVAAVLWEQLRGRGHRVPLGRDGGPEDIPLDTVGWFSADAGTVPGLLPDAIRYDVVRPWRARVWQGIGDGAGWATGPASLVGHPLPAPGDAKVMRLADGNGELGWHRVVELAADLSVPVERVVRSFRRLRIASRRITPPRIGEGPLGWIPDRMDRRVSAVVAGALDEMHQTGLGGVGSFDWEYEGLVWLSRRDKLTLGQLARRCARYAPLSGLRNLEVPDHHEQYVCTDEDIDLLHVLCDGSKWKKRRVHWPWDVREVALRLARTPDEILDRLAAFAWLGWTVPSRADVDAWLAAPTELAPWLARHARAVPDSGPVLEGAAALELSADRDISLGAAEAELLHWTRRLGIAYEEHGMTLDHDAVLSADAGSVVSALRRPGRRPQLAVTMENLFVYQEYGDVSGEKLLKAVAELRDVGVPVPDNIALVTEWYDLPIRTRAVFCGKDPWIDSGNPPAPDVTPCVLFGASLQLREPLREVWRLAEREVGRFGASPPSFPEELAEYRLTGHESVLLDAGEYGEIRSASWVPLTPGRLAYYAWKLGVDAATAYERLLPLRALGALVPRLTDPQLAALREVTPGERDVTALGKKQRVSPPDGPFCALDLVSIAGRFGESVRETWGRIAPYTPLGPASHVPDIPDVVPLWQDLALLTVHLDGALPALTGRVEGRHVAFAAREVEEKEEWVGERLHVYAKMFELDLGGLPGPAAAEERHHG
ncbi:caspase family protein [Streptomyces sp. UNOC14_S4]|uniref:HD domain-containing protein n=1 Tax=Streptomyces sp. UNOC14_S4 TaxID=2872340 RepID=UPI0023B0EA2B|nr:caspase family protein [Streptomyces sp. UNOC14_S4]MCC3767614.1 caspase family protein [Streptomyces sp. UNOC14_S4]